MTGRVISGPAAVERLRLAWSQVAKAQRLAVDEDRDHDAILLGEVLGMLGERPAPLPQDPPESGHRIEARLGEWTTLPALGPGARVSYLPVSGDRDRVWLEVGPVSDAEVPCPAVHYSTIRCTGGVRGHDRIRREDDSTLWDHGNPTAGCWWDGPDVDQRDQPAAAESTATALALTLAETRGRQAAFSLAAQMIENHCEWLGERVKAAQRDVAAQAGGENYLSAAWAQNRADALGQARVAARELFDQVQALEGDAG